MEDFVEQVVHIVRRRKAKSILLVPPDITRLDSKAGLLTISLHKRLVGECELAVLPATGLHKKMNAQEKELMFTDYYRHMLFLEHDADHGCEHLGQYDASHHLLRNEEGGQMDYLADSLAESGLSSNELSSNELSSNELSSNELSSNELSSKFTLEVAVSKHLFRYDLVLSLGQIVPHEVLGLSSFTKNIVIGLGGGDVISKTHWWSALYGLENVILKMDNPIRSLVNEIFFQFIKTRHPAISFLHTIVEKKGNEAKVLGLSFGDDLQTFKRAARVSIEKNACKLSRPLRKAYVWMPEVKYQYTWLSNKAIYRLKQVMLKDAELVIIAPGVKAFSNEVHSNELIKQIGYFKRDQVMKKFRLLPKTKELARHPRILAILAHLLHGGDISFKVTYSVHPEFKAEDLRQAGYGFLSAPRSKKFYLENRALFDNDTIRGDVAYLNDPGLKTFVLEEKGEKNG